MNQNINLNSAGFRFRQAMQREKPLQIVGAINANHALLASQAGFNAIYLSGGGVAAGSLGIPDLGITTLEDILIDINRITNVTDTPLLVDVDTGFGPSAFNVARTVKSLIKAGAAALHIEDQVGAKRCGHRPGKEVVSKSEMSDRIKAAADARTDQHFVLGARTDAFASEGLEATLDRAVAYAEAGADFIFAEAVHNLVDYQKFVDATGIPVLANITEFGMIPMYTVAQLEQAGVGLVLYPLSAFRAANRAAQNVYTHIRQDGTQAAVIDTMQTREQLYQSIGYYAYEEKLDQLFKQNKDVK
ncbi:methylisocitrate lyase [Pedobacter antarcticus]|uniref:2-methylisocitrate lyase n=1 Tax=Pedobacter antarcticus TaxID=34086 RepID=A0A1I2FBS5_9SPHI|nr:methylisocitrate lyase [Pedobacter antarcticus]SFF02934.1 methylisocitrate lyase [Pedobacter antarcticus]